MSEAQASLALGNRSRTKVVGRGCTRVVGRAVAVGECELLPFAFAFGFGFGFGFACGCS